MVVHPGALALHRNTNRIAFALPAEPLLFPAV